MQKCHPRPTKSSQVNTLPKAKSKTRSKQNASRQVSATSLKLLILQINPHVRVERHSGMCVARFLFELWGRSPYTRMLVARTSH